VLIFKIFGENQDNAPSRLLLCRPSFSSSFVGVAVFDAGVKKTSGHHKRVLRFAFQHNIHHTKETVDLTVLKVLHTRLRPGIAVTSK